jgi:hypothetical protein
MKQAAKPIHLTSTNPKRKFQVHSFFTYESRAQNQQDNIRPFSSLVNVGGNWSPREKPTLSK